MTTTLLLIIIFAPCYRTGTRGISNNLASRSCEVQGSGADGKRTFSDRMGREAVSSFGMSNCIQLVFYYPIACKNHEYITRRTSILPGERVYYEEIEYITKKSGVLRRERVVCNIPLQTKTFLFNKYIR
jgi:hypothetical protein